MAIGTLTRTLGTGFKYQIRQILFLKMAEHTGWRSTARRSTAENQLSPIKMAKKRKREISEEAATKRRLQLNDEYMNLPTEMFDLNLNEKYPEILRSIEYIPMPDSGPQALPYGINDDIEDEEEEDRKDDAWDGDDGLKPLGRSHSDIKYIAAVAESVELKVYSEDDHRLDFDFRADDYVEEEEDEIPQEDLVKKLVAVQREELEEIEHEVGDGGMDNDFLQDYQQIEVI